MKKPGYLTLYDFRQAFDSLWLKESILSLWNLGIRNEFLPLIYKLNQKATVTINTPYGKTSPIYIKELVKQGTVLASSICSASTGEICNGGKSMAVGELIVLPLAFVDDIAKVNPTPTDVLESHAKMISFSSLKKLELNEGKCYGLVVTRTTRILVF